MKLTHRFKIADGGELTYIQGFLSPLESKKLFNELKEKVPWQTIRKTLSSGVTITFPRVLYAMRDEGVDITSVYNVTDSMVWLDCVKEIKERIERELNIPITYAQLNYYRDGKDSIGYHTDKEVVKGDSIVSLSIGAERMFILRHESKFTDDVRDDIKTEHKFMLQNGSLFIMNDNAAKYHWKHAVPKMDKAGARINITFRPR